LHQRPAERDKLSKQEQPEIAMTEGSERGAKA
jgi:hypothetical protein